MANLRFTQIRMLLKYLDEQTEFSDARVGPVLTDEFDVLGTIDQLSSSGWSSKDIVSYIISSNPVLWAQYWLRNPQDPAKPLELFTHQKRILNCSNNRKLTRCGRQVGKTLCMAVDILYSCMTQSNLKALYVAPYQAQVEVLFNNTLKPLIFDVPEIHNSIIRMGSQPFKATFANGSEVSARTAGTRSGLRGAGIRGSSANRLYLDEMDYMGSEAIAAVVATTFARPDATIWASSTPVGKREEFYHWAMDSGTQFRCLKCMEAERLGSPFHYPSHVSPLFTEEAESFYRTQMPHSEYEHEVLAEWGEEAEGVFRHTDIDACLMLGRRVVEDEVNGGMVRVSYSYGDLVADPANAYMLGIDWNKDTTGVQLCVVEYNPTEGVVNGLDPKMYRLFGTEIITAKEFTEDGAVARIMSLDQELPLTGIYADEGYGTLQIEAIKRRALRASRTELAKKVVGISMVSSIDIYDPVTKKRGTKPMKPFMVDHAARVIEAHKIILPDHEDEKVKLVGQMREYLVMRRGVSGRPIYSMDNEDMLTAFMLALLGFATEFSELTNVESDDSMSIMRHGIAARVVDAVPSRTEQIDGNAKVSFADVGVTKRGPLFADIAAAADVPYAFTPNVHKSNIDLEQIEPQFVETPEYGLRKTSGRGAFAVTPKASPRGRVFGGGPGHRSSRSSGGPSRRTF